MPSLAGGYNRRIAGREFFDAVVPLDAIDAVLIRTKE